ncbi:hypothetical protein ABE82_14735 [Paenibacillus peoriae]|uniref:helix-turn-helix domain-containing protein n=1 Tax=Paenibacillus peoriae TaxID=59893 RepID=UPI0006A7230E|nr:helix-turn-helix transcriptional regulator [Paenibacillus peoriae]ALA42681.1 hypothetical protein ABE82_14735 [Paenibacillus peoriae]
MLKERIEFLCKKKNLSRKELVDGLVTPAHFANILADRYPLAEDLAEQIAGRLGVNPSYLLRAAAEDEETLTTADKIFTELSKLANPATESYVDLLEDRNDSLVVEMTTYLMKAVYYQQLNDPTAYEYLHQTYLNFYLEKFGRSDEVELPAPLKKAILFYKIQYFRSKNHYYDVLNNVKQLSRLVEEGTENWLNAQNIMMEACIQVKQFDQAKQVFEQTMRRVYDDRRFHRLTGLYVAYSGYCFAMGSVQEALLTLSMAEANLVYLENAADMLTTILNNRIIMLTSIGELDKALEEVARFEALVSREREEMQQMMLPVTLIYRCEIAFARKNWGLLSQHLDQLRKTNLTTDQQMGLDFYESQLALAQGNQDAFWMHALQCLPYFEALQHPARLEQLYETLAVVSEDSRRYKESSAYYRKLVYLLRKK